MAHLNTAFQGLHQHNWSQAIYQLEQAGEDYVIATVLGVAGSTPRAGGTKMVISQAHIYDTLGGGHLEFKVIEKARQLLAANTSSQAVEVFHLAANLGQCCGGSVIVMFEAIICQQMTLDIYGAGHVAHALIDVMGKLPIRIRWIDSRADIFPQHIPSNVEKVIDEDPVAQVKRAKENSAYLILTHSHQLDFSLTEAILKRDNVLWLGVIGSETKAKRFKHRLQHKDFNQEKITQMQCPVGLKNVSGKLPMEVAVSIAGQLINLYQQFNATKNASSNKSNIKWSQLKGMLLTQSSLNTDTPTAINPEEVIA